MSDITLYDIGLMFKEKVDKVKYPNVNQEYRFELQDLESVAGFKESEFIK